MKQRIYWVDTLKGLLIMLVIMGHRRGGNSFSEIFLLSKVYIYSFHMPLFFFLSGYVFRIKDNDNFVSFFKRKVRCLVVPLVFFSVVISLFQYVYYGILLGHYDEYNIERLLNKAMGVIVENGSGIYQSSRWFLASLFVIHILMYAIIKVAKDDLKKVGLYSIVICLIGLLYIQVGPNLPWMIDTSFIMLFFVAAGYISAKKEWKINFKVAFVAMLVHISALWMNYKVLNLAVDPMTNRLGNIVYFFAESMGGIVVMIFIAKHIKKCEFINYIGKNSLVYYGFLDMMVFVPDILVYNILHLKLEELGLWNFLIWIMYAIIICLAIIPINEILNKYFGVFIGKKSIKQQIKVVNK